MKNLFGVTSFVTGLYQNMGIALFSRSQSLGITLRQAALRNPGVLMLMIGVALTLMPSPKCMQPAFRACSTSGALRCATA
ncbi:hypothetical protein ACTJNK_33770 (plasmid) [Achromobacter anxifer]